MPETRQDRSSGEAWGGHRPLEGWVGALLKEAEEFGGLLTWWGGAYSTGRIFLQVSPCQGRRQRCVGGELTGYGERKRKEREAEARCLETEMGLRERAGKRRDTHTGRGSDEEAETDTGTLRQQRETERNTQRR